MSSGIKVDDWQEIEERLYEPFDEDDVEWIEADDGKNFANSNPRVYEDRLDNVLGANNWSCDHEAINGKTDAVKATVYILIDGDWVGKSSLGENDFLNAKWTGKEAQAFKRACSKWGVGRFLYGLQPDNFDDFASVEQLVALDNIGRVFYGAEWVTKQRQLVSHITEGKGISPGELTGKQCDTLLLGVNEKLAAHFKVNTSYPIGNKVEDKPLEELF